MGVFSAQSLIDGYGNLFNTSYGPWMSWPTAGTRSSNPYVRAHFLVQDRLPISQFEVSELEALVDNKGEDLNGNCTYEITGLTPKAQWWSVFTFSRNTGPGDLLPNRTGINSQQVIYQPDGSFKITLSSEPQPGNWIVPADGGDVVLVLRHYNPGRSIASQGKFENLPTITKRGCR